MQGARTFGLIMMIVTGLGGIFPAWAAHSSSTTDSYLRLLREASVILLKEGNARYAAGNPQHPNLDAARRTNTVAEGQEPFATVLACSDSREPVEYILDRGIGDLFVVRVAGNVGGESELASIEYGVGHLHTPLLVVMGHTRCGAVTAVVNGAELHGHLAMLAERIKPAAAQVLGHDFEPEEAIAHAVKANVWQAISDVLTQSSIVRTEVASGKVQVLGAVYDLESGRVEWLGNHPDQEMLLSSPAPVPVPHVAAHPVPPQQEPGLTRADSKPAEPVQPAKVDPDKSLFAPLSSKYLLPTKESNPFPAASQEDQNQHPGHGNQPASPPPHPGGH